MALFYFTHVSGSAPAKYKWSLTSEKDRALALPSESLKDRVKEFLESEDGKKFKAINN